METTLHMYAFVRLSLNGTISDYASAADDYKLGRDSMLQEASWKNDTSSVMNSAAV